MADEPVQRPSQLARVIFKNDDARLDGRLAGRQLLLARDQRVIASVILVALGIVFLSWLTSSGPWGGLVDIDEAEPLQATFQVDLNSADWPELSQLPEVGETLAKRIVESREKEGLFSSHDDLSRVKGIGPKTLEKIKPYLWPIE